MNLSYFRYFNSIILLVLVVLVGCKPTATPTPTPTTIPATLTPVPATPTPTAEPVSSTGSTQTVHPKQVAGYIPNPYMGWQDTQTKNKRFAETVAYQRYNWDILNPADGTYDWTPIEAELEAAVKNQGSKFSLRIRTARPPPWGEGQVMPDWLVAKGVQIAEGDSDIEGVHSIEPLYHDCLFLAAHAHFIDAMRQKFDGDPAIAFIDVGSYGNYGEWHSEQYDDEPDSLDWHARRRIIDMYLGGRATRPCLQADGQIVVVTYDYPGFQQTQLIMPFTPWFEDSLKYALSRRHDIGIRHDALGSERHQTYYQEQIGDLVEDTWPNAPIIFEFSSKAYQPKQLEIAREFVQTMHASIVHDNFDGGGDDARIEALLAVLGYKLVLNEITYTAELAAGQNLLFDMTWENIGVAPPYYQTNPLVMFLTDTQGQPVLYTQIEPNLKTWLPGQPIELQGTIDLPATVSPGQYDLRLAFLDPATGQSALNLAIEGRDELGRYLLGPVKVLPR